MGWWQIRTEDGRALSVAIANTDDGPKVAVDMALPAVGPLLFEDAQVQEIRSALGLALAEARGREQIRRATDDQDPGWVGEG